MAIYVKEKSLRSTIAGAASANPRNLCNLWLDICLAFRVAPLALLTAACSF